MNTPTSLFPRVLSTVAACVAVQAQQLETQLLVDGLNQPVFAASPPDGTDRLFVLERGTSTVRVFDQDSASSGTDATFLDLSAVVGSPGGFDGLLGLAFHPNYANNRRLFLYYSTPNMVGSRTLVIGEFRQSTANPDSATTTTPVATIFSGIAAAGVDHVGGTIAFGNDGYLYAAIGDGNNANPVQGISQDVGSLHGKVLRFDVDAPSPYIPTTNPFLSDPNALDAIWAVGLRNPYGFSFDPVTGDLWIGDVGQNSFEEINRVGAGNGGWDFQWDYMEGNMATGIATTPYSGAVQVGPVFDYPHAVGNSIYAVIGGHVYRGDDLCWMRGRYFFGDFGTTSLSSFDPSSPSLSLVDHSADVGLDAINGPIDNLNRICLDSRGELLLVEPFDPNTGFGAVWRVRSTPQGTPYVPVPQTPNTTGQVATIGARGSLSIADNTLCIVGGDLPANVFRHARDVESPESRGPHRRRPRPALPRGTYPAGPSQRAVEWRNGSIRIPVRPSESAQRHHHCRGRCVDPAVVVPRRRLHQLQRRSRDHDPVAEATNQFIVAPNCAPPSAFSSRWATDHMNAPAAAHRTDS